MSRHFILTIVAIFCILSVAHTQIVITSVFDADLPGGLPKGVELYTLEDIPDLSIFGVGIADNGAGTNGVEFTFPMEAMDAYTYFYVASDSSNFTNFFGFDCDFPNVGAMLINGDDAVELFMNGAVIDIFGEIDASGTGTGWEYKDGWAARKNSTGPDSTVFDIENWNFSGVGGLDNVSTNAGAVLPVRVKMYNDSTSGEDPDVTVITQNIMFTPRDITIELGQTVRWTNPEKNTEHNVNGGQNVYPCNPVGFFSGIAAFGPWDFDVTFDQPGYYKYQCDPHTEFDMFGSVTVVDSNAMEYPAYDIALLTTVNADGVTDSLAVDCQVEGIVYGANIRPPGLLFTIIDDAGDGISIFKNDVDCYEVTEGDRLIVKGNVGQFSGLTQMNIVEQIAVLSSGNPLLDPMLLEEPLGQDTKSKFVIIESTTVDSLNVSGVSGWIVRTSNANANYTLFLDNDVFDEPGVEVGDVITVTGIGSQFDATLPFTAGYLLLPRWPEDIEIILGTKFLPANSIVMYPNPTSDIVRFETDLLIKTVEIYTTSGELVSVSRNSFVSVGAYSAGLYIVKIYTADGVWTDRFIKTD